MKITVDKVLKSATSLVEFTKIKLPMNISLILASNQRELNQVVAVAETKRVALVEKWGKKNEDGDFTVKGEDAEIFLKERAAMLDEVVDISLKSITVKALPENQIEINDYVITDDLVIEASVLVDLDWMLVKPKKVSEKVK